MRGRHFLFNLSDFLLQRNEVEFYKKFLLNDEKSFDILLAQQNDALKLMINHCYYNIPFYQKKFKQLGLFPDDIKGVDDLKFLPILHKEEIRDNFEEFKCITPTKSINGTTGGSTGIPLKYEMSKECYKRGVALLYRGWHRAGYNIGDKIVFFAGASLVGKESLLSKINKYTKNITTFSSYGVSDAEYLSVISYLETTKPEFLRGYATSIAALARFVIESKKNLTYRPKGIFTTAEMLSNQDRKTIEAAFNTKVYNQYGLNDGGISAFEDGENNGFLIDSERSFMESVSGSRRVFNQPGNLIATSLYNYSFPFIRYDTGDIGMINERPISGENRLRLTALLGRETDMIEINGRRIGSPVLTVLMGKFDILRYQVIKEKNELRFIINKGNNFTRENELTIKQSILEKLGKAEIIFDYSGEFFKSKNKHKFIVDLDK